MDRPPVLGFLGLTLYCFLKIIRNTCRLTSMRWKCRMIPIRWHFAISCIGFWNFCLWSVLYCGPEGQYTTFHKTQWHFTVFLCSVKCRYHLSIMIIITIIATGLWYLAKQDFFHVFTDNDWLMKRSLRFTSGRFEGKTGCIKTTVRLFPEDTEIKIQVSLS